MKRISDRSRWIFILMMFLPVATQAADYGTITHNGISMPVRAVIAQWDPQGPRLSVYLLPFEPTEEERAKCAVKCNPFFWGMERPSPDPAKWPNSTPFGSYSLSWFEAAEVKDLGKAFAHVYTFAVGRPNSNMNLSFSASDRDKGTVSLEGELANGSTVKLRAEGSGTLGDDEKVSWRLDLSTEIIEKRAK